jgi:hypothetical protein
MAKDELVVLEERGLPTFSGVLVSGICGLLTFVSITGIIEEKDGAAPYLCALLFGSSTGLFAFWTVVGWMPNMRAAIKRLRAMRRRETLVDIRKLPDETRHTLAPLLRPSDRFFTIEEAEQLLRAGCMLLEGHQRIIEHRANLAKADTALNVASAMSEISAPVRAARLRGHGRS